ncbi:TonB-dependent receptor family protein [Chelatococcus reniformis]|uniref:TonB-dependent receptor n=1 Tax=Chelatococcus reniformis TaxID=1494448 RepID=A0A916UV60_9HYPH|nr:TonB-dependent receptor [Chelatococcus reniformis]GGC88302.1 TonB-dependent receptor [Chelatococcus reniformis]
MFSIPLRAGAAVVLASLAGTGAFAQDVTLPTIDISGGSTATGPAAMPAAGGSLTVPSVAEQKRALYQSAGSVSFVDEKQFDNTYSNNLRDVLKDTPGVYVQERYGQELRLSVRGSGLTRGYHLRGLDILQDGIPVNAADGSGDFYQIDPLAVRTAEVYRGANGLFYGTSTIGGAINFTTPTAYTAEAPNVLRIDGGSFGALRGNVQMSRISGPFDALVNATVSHANGFRQHETQDYKQFNANLGYRINENVETRFYFGFYDTDQKLPGSLSLFNALRFPKMASPAAISGNQARDVLSERIANTTTIRFDVGQLDISTWAIHKNLYHPIFQVIAQDGWTYGIAPRYTASFDIGGFKNDLIVGGRAWGGNNLARQFVNVNGNKGAPTVNARQDAYNLEGYAENRFWVLRQLALVAGVKVFNDLRDYTQLYNASAKNPRQRQQDDARYAGVNPKFGILWQATPDIQVFADIARSTDVPDFTDLTQVFTNSTTFVPLQAQRAWTAEVGTRGRWDRLSFEVTAYRSILRDELLNYTTNPNVPAATFNALHTRHQGIELAVGYDLLRDVTGIGDKLTVQQIWTYNDFRFVNDPYYGNNRLAGIPTNVLRTVVSYSRPDGFYVSPNVDWVPTGAYADYANTLRAPGYALLGVQAGWAMPNGMTFFVDARNLTDRRYISDLSTVTNAQTLPASSLAIFYPGNGRSVYAGLRYAF